MTKIWKKITAAKKFGGSKNTIYLSLGLHKGRLSYRRSLQPSKDNIQYFKHEISEFFPIFVGNFFPLGSGYGSTDLIESGSNPDPKHG